MNCRSGLCVRWLTVVVLAACSSDQHPAGPDDTPIYDTTPPANVEDLRILMFDESSVTIEWTAPGDNGTNGTATEYAIGYSDLSITPESWASCAMLASCPTPTVAGTRQSARIEGPPVPHVYVALRAVDDSGNWADLSNVAHNHVPGTSDWTTYDTSTGLAHDAVSGVAAAPDGTLWCTHPVEGGGGVSRFDGTLWKNFTTADGLGSNLILWFQAIAVSDVGEVWVGTYDNGVSLYSGDSWTVYTTDHGMLSDLVAAVGVAPDGDVWCVGPGVSHFDGEVWETFDLATIGLPEYVFAVSFTPDGSVWFGGIGLRRFDGETWIDHSEHHRYERGPVVSIAVTSAGVVWVVGDGATSFDGQAWRHFGLKDMGLADTAEAAITSVAVGADGTVWAGTSDQGVVRYDGTIWTRYTAEHGLADDSVFSVAVARDGAVWLGTNNGMSRYSGE